MPGFRGLLLMLLLPVTAMAASPVPTELYAEVDHGLRAAAVLADPVSYRGRTLLLGGIVVRTISEAGQVIIAVDGYRLGKDDRPEQVDPQLGTVVAAGNDLDGGSLQPGRLVTLVGTVTGLADAAEMTVPSLQIRFIHPWPTAAEEAAPRIPACAPGYCCDPWGYDPWYGSGYCGPYPRWRFGFGYSRHWH